MKCFREWQNENGEEEGYGIKVLSPTGATYPARRGGADIMEYALPRPGEKWGPWNIHPKPSKPDKEGCGPGRYHAWRGLRVQYGPPQGYPWFAHWRKRVSSSEDKIGALEIRLRAIQPKVLHRALCPPFNWGQNTFFDGLDLSGVRLQRADLHSTIMVNCNLQDIVLRDADLSGTALKKCILASAHIHDTNLRGSQFDYSQLNDVVINRAVTEGRALWIRESHGISLTLRESDVKLCIYSSDLPCLNIIYSNVRDTVIENSNLRGAALQLTTFKRCTFRNVDFSLAKLYQCDFYHCSFRGCNLEGAQLFMCQFHNRFSNTLQGCTIADSNDWHRCNIAPEAEGAIVINRRKVS